MNTLIHYLLPNWVAIAFLMAIPIPFILICFFLKKEARKVSNKLVFPLTIFFFIAYLSYIFIASKQGSFNQVSLPPKVLVYTTFPYAFLLFAIVLNLKIYKTILQNATIESLVKLHLFRVIGVFFLILAFYNALPKTFAIIAGCGDIITAITSVFVAKTIVNKKNYAKKLTLIWNVFGTVDIMFTAIAANIITKVSIETGVMGVDTLAIFPFCIIPAFAPPTILFLHLAIFKKLRNFP